MNKYFVEYFFSSDFDNQYWFPFVIVANDIDEANVKSVVIQTAIESEFTLMSQPKLTRIIDSLNSELIDNHISQNLKGKVVSLNLNVWRFTELNTVPELNFNEHLQLINIASQIEESTIASLVSQYKFPVKLINFDDDVEQEEFLLLSVVDPANIEELSIFIEVNESLKKNNVIKQLEEGVWKETNIRDYMIRIDTNHIDKEKKHVHIAHKKHINSKNKQVSWDVNGRKHDKKTFDLKFVGMNKAKKIARKVLNISYSVLLEEYKVSISGYRDEYGIHLTIG